MILGIPDFIFMLLAMLGVSVTFSVIMLVLYFLAPSNAKKLLSARLKKTGLLAIFGKASLRFVKVKSIAPGWVETEEGKKYIWPIPPKEKGSHTWNPVRDVMSKVERIDNIPVLAVYEAECLASNSDALVSLEAYTKGYDTEQLPFSVNPTSNPGQSKFVYIPVNPKLLAETLRGMITSEHIDVFEKFVIDVERKRSMKDWKSIAINFGLIVGGIVAVAVIALLIVSGHI
ncbi:hypothetical protein DRO54_05190 [Candidatus Bathyarchaeota archaeon]|nr:MAG: hypothetical protein DRO54_05190 [Candidatus Bathyarchaeota archaeon]